MDEAVEALGSVLREAAGRLVVDSGYRYPGRPEIGEPADVVIGETDPGALATVSALVAEFRWLYTEITGHPPVLDDGYTEAEIAEAEAALGVRLPEDLRALYREVRDDRGDFGLLDRCFFESLDLVVRRHAVGLDAEGSLFFPAWPPDHVAVDSDRPDLVRRVPASGSRVVFATDNRDFYSVDLDPAAGGRRGQVLISGSDYNGQFCYLAESVTSMLADVVAALRNGDYELGMPGPEPLGTQALIDPVVGFTRRPTYGDTYRRRPRLHGRGLAETISALPGPEAVQHLELSDEHDLDLAALSPLKNLRELRVVSAGSVVPRLPHSVPVESLSVQARHCELGGLAGHPTLWDLTLGGGEVDIRSLAGLPALARLDLSGVEVRDLGRLTEFGGLRVLVLNARQWRLLREAGPCPPGLAAAERSDGSSLAEAAEWAGWVQGQEPPRVRHASGG